MADTVIHEIVPEWAVICVHLTCTPDKWPALEQIGQNISYVLYTCSAQQILWYFPPTAVQLWHIMFTRVALIVTSLTARWIALLIYADPRKFKTYTVFKCKYNRLIIISWRLYDADVSMAKCKTAVTLLLARWSYCNLALNHRYVPMNWVICFVMVACSVNANPIAWHVAY